MKNAIFLSFKALTDVHSEILECKIQYKKIDSKIEKAQAFNKKDLFYKQFSRKLIYKLKRTTLINSHKDTSSQSLLSLHFEHSSLCVVYRDCTGTTQRSSFCLLRLLQI